MPQTLSTLSSRARTPQFFYKNQKNFKTEFSLSLSEKTPRSPHQSRTSYSLLSLLTSRAPKIFSDAQNLLHTLFFFLTKLGHSFSPQKKNAKEKVFLSFHSGFLYQNPCSSHFHLRFSLIQLWKVSPSTSETSSINTPHSHEVSCSLHIYSIASLPRIHMDSWWAAKNLNQDPKWTQNIARAM